MIRWEAGCSLSEFSVLQNRVAELEEKVESMQASMYPQEQGSNGHSLVKQRSPTKLDIHAPKAEDEVPVESPTPTAGVTASSTTTGQRNGEDDAVMMLEDFAMGNRANARRAAQNLVHSEGLGHVQSDASPDGLRLETAANQRSGDLALDVAYRFLRLSPSPDIVREMVDYYFAHIEWYTKCLHQPSYMEDLNVLLSLEPEAAAQSIRPTYLCIHFMIICLVVHMCTAEEAQAWGYHRQAAIQLCDAFFAGSQQLLWASDFIGSHQLEHLQAVILLSVYAYNVDEQADAAYALVGASIKIAQNLALNRLDDPRLATKAKAVNANQQQAPLERELSKRVWWYLVWLDWSHALSHGGCYSIHSAHNKTNLPGNINDEDLKRGGPITPKPLDQYTSMSFTIWRLRFLTVYRETIDILNSPTGMTHANLLEMDKKLIDLLHGLPPYFQIDTDDSANWTYGDSCYDMERLSIQITAHNRLLRLHRPFLAKALTDKKNISRRRCVDAAYKMLALFRHAKDHAPLLLKVWINIYYAFSGALVIFLDLCYDDGSDAQATEKKRTALREMLEICNAARHLSAAAKNTYSLLHGLLEAETDLRVHQRQEVRGTSKRKRSKTKSDESQGSATFSPFTSLVERVLVDAASRNGSGESATSSLARSPSDAGTGTLFEPPIKRHSTSFVRDRAHSHTSSHTYDGSGQYGRNSPYAGSGAGHGGYYQYDGGQASHGNQAHHSQSASSTGGVPPSSAQPRSPWGVSSVRGSTHWASGNGSTANASGGMMSSPGLSGPLGSPSYTPTDGMPMGMASFSPQLHRSGGPAATTNGLSSLLDEDIFSGLLMNQHMENNSDWESALAFVAPPPPS